MVGQGIGSGILSGRVWIPIGRCALLRMPSFSEIVSVSFQLILKLSKMCDKASIMDPNKFWTVKVKKKKKMDCDSIYHELVLNFLYLIKPSSKPP